MPTPEKILRSFDFIYPGDKVRIKKVGLDAVVKFVIISGEGIKINIEEDNNLYEEKEYFKISNFNGRRNTFFL